MPLFTQFSCFLRLTSLGTSFWLKMSSHLNVIHYCRADTASFSYFCLITRLLLFKPLETPMFCKVEIRQNIMQPGLVMALVISIASSLLYFDHSQINHVFSYQITPRMIIIVGETACPHDNKIQPSFLKEKLICCLLWAMNSQTFTSMIPCEVSGRNASLEAR